jgi:hypothetical protein
MNLHRASVQGFSQYARQTKPSSEIIVWCVVPWEGGLAGIAPKLRQSRNKCSKLPQSTIKVQSDSRCPFAVPSHAVPGALALPGHNPKFDDRGLMPVFDLTRSLLASWNWARIRLSDECSVESSSCPSIKAGASGKCQQADSRDRQE